MARPVDRQSSKRRREHLERLFTDVVLPQRRRLLQARDHTWQSAYVDDDGYLAELVAAFCLGVPGTFRKGVSTTTGDLCDGTEVKKGYRLDPNIDFVLRGEATRLERGWGIELADLPAELHLADIASQLNANTSSVQVLQDGPGGTLGGPLWRTTSKSALVPGDAGRAPLLKLSGSPAGIHEGQTLEVCVRQERGHINFGAKTRAQLGHIIDSKPVLVFYQHDVRGRFSVAIVQIRMTAKENASYLRRVFGTSTGRRQVQPYLYPDNARQALYADSAHSVRDGLQGHLLAYGVEAPGGFEFLHWEVEAPPRVADCEDLLLQVADPARCPDFRHPRSPVRWSDAASRQDFARRFFDDSIVGYSRAIQPYCAMASSTRNIGFGNLSQHLAGICTGLRGTRSGARGKDLVEPDGVTPSEIKLATGEKGDAMGTEDMPRLTLGWGDQKMLSWKRLIAVRLVELEQPGGPRWRAMVHAPDQATMRTFRDQVNTYFHGRVNNGSGGLQYHARRYPHHDYGTADHSLVFRCVAEFCEGEPASFPAPMPDWR